MNAPRRQERVTVARDPQGAIHVSFAGDTIRIDPDAASTANLEHLDFAAWLMLPLAMRRNLDLLVVGAGSATTARNAVRLSEIWSRWLPMHFDTADVAFTETSTQDAAPAGTGDLCLYSGGIDSTYGLLKRHREGASQSLLTVHGMDYRYADGERFAALLEKTAPFANLVSDRRLLVRTNAYDIYKRHRVNPKGSDVGHGFVLAAMTFLYSESFARAVLAADHRLDQEFEVFPWGTNSATNPLFDDGRFHMHTEGLDVSRAEKCPLLLLSPEALASLTFCVDYGSRPHNCGRCQKCVRTKAMFLASTGSVPSVCQDSSLRPNCLDSFDMRRNNQRAFLFDLYQTAKRSGNAARIPGLEALYRKSVERSVKRNPWARFKRWIGR